MTTINHDELRRFAEEAITLNPTYHYQYVFENAATPQTVLALLDEIEAMKKDTELMDWIEKNCLRVVTVGTERIAANRPAIQAAMEDGK